MTVSMAKARAIKKRHAKRLMAHPSVWGVGVELDARGKPVLVVHVDARDKAVRQRLPSAIEGCPVRVVSDAPFTKQ